MNQTAPATIPGLDRVQRISLVVGVVGLILCAIGYFVSPSQFFQSYLVAYIYWLGIALGCLFFALLHLLAGGTWGAAIFRFAQAGANTLPALAVLFLPLLLGLPILYPWARPAVVAADPVLQYKSVYLNVPFFIVRAVVYFAVWIGLAWLMNRWVAARQRAPDPKWSERLQALGAIGLVLFFLTITFALIDWLMSLEPRWHSSVYGAMVGTGEVLAGLAFITLVVILLSNREPMSAVVTPRLYNDLGSMLAATVLMWAYLQFSQLLVIYAGNLTEEIAWYLKRTQGGWQWFPLVLVIFDFALPFFFLISRPLKRNPRPLAAVAALLVVMHYIALLWLVEPAFSPAALSLSWLNIVAPIGLGGIWIALYIWRFGQWSPLPIADPQMIQYMEWKHEHAESTSG